MKYKLIINFILTAFVLYALSMFLIERRMNRNIIKYEVACKVIEKTVAGTRTKRTIIEYQHSQYKIDSDNLYYKVEVGNTVKLLYFKSLDLIMIPNDNKYFELFLTSLFMGILFKLLLYLKW